MMTLKARTAAALSSSNMVGIGFAFSDDAFNDYICVDCGVNTFPGAPPPAIGKIVMDTLGETPLTASAECEVYMVKSAVWEKAAMEPSGGCLCVGCLEGRLGRRLRPKDFVADHPFNQSTMPATPRLRERRGR